MMRNRPFSMAYMLVMSGQVGKYHGQWQGGVLHFTAGAIG
jgi:hypothetical protein